MAFPFAATPSSSTSDGGDWRCAPLRDQAPGAGTGRQPEAGAHGVAQSLPDDSHRKTVQCGRQQIPTTHRTCARSARGHVLDLRGPGTEDLPVCAETGGAKEVAASA